MINVSTKVLFFFYHYTETYFYYSFNRIKIDQIYYYHWECNERSLLLLIFVKIHLVKQIMDYIYISIHIILYESNLELTENPTVYLIVHL